MRLFAAALILPFLFAGAARAECPAGYGALTSASASAEFAAARVTPNQAVSVGLHPVGEVRFTVPPERRGEASSYGGMLELNAREAGTYQVSLSAGAWIDVLKDGAAVTSTAHGHDTGCADFRKMVTFPLRPGRYVIQLSGNKEAALKLLVSAKGP